MPAPFRDDAVFREERAAELLADRVELQRTLRDAETRIRAGQQVVVGSLLANARSVVGGAFIVIALAGGYAVGRWVVGDSSTYVCR